MTIDEFRAWLHSDDSGDGDIVGMTAAEIAEACAAQHVETLPPSYREFLVLCGRSARQFELGSAFNYPYLLGQKEALEEALAENRDEFQVPPRAFVFDGHQGYSFWFFEDVTAEPPIVAYWSEGPPANGRYFHTFEQWLDAEVAARRLMFDNRRREEVGGDWHDNPTFSYEPLRTFH